jgi:hypothetical protein
MPKRSRSEDVNETAFRIVRKSTREHDEPVASGPSKPKKKNPAAVALGRIGGLKGGRARAAKLTVDERAESARHAANVRWSAARSKR